MCRLMGSNTLNNAAMRSKDDHNEDDYKEDNNNKNNNQLWRWRENV